jgi:DNA transposition AAA+ family ATPase
MLVSMRGMRILRCPLGHAASCVRGAARFIDRSLALKVSGLEQVRDIFDHRGIGLVLIRMPGIEKRLARYPQFYSRMGFVHEFRPLDAAAINIKWCGTAQGLSKPE